MAPLVVLHVQANVDACASGMYAVSLADLQEYECEVRRSPTRVFFASTSHALCSTAASRKVPWLLRPLGGAFATSAKTPTVPTGTRDAFPASRLNWPLFWRANAVWPAS